MHSQGYNKRVILLILIFLVLRIITASVLELGNDEAYYWLYSQQLQWNYFDHPPMIAVWIKLFTLNGLLDNYEGMIRAGSVISCAFSTWFLYKAVSLIKDQRAGWFAACLYNASLYTGLVAGVQVMPDSSQLFFWTFCLWQIAKLMQDDNNKWTWILFGISAGLCVMSKVHGLFIWTGFGAFILFKKREWLKKPIVYISFLLSILIFSPIAIWNLNYDFITWQFHSARIDINQPAPEKDGFWKETFEQILINNPFNFLLIITALFASFKIKKLHPALIAYNFIGLPLILLLTFISAFRDIWYHWSGPAYTSLLPLAAIWLSQFNTRSAFPSWLKWSTAFFTVIMLMWPLAVYYYPGTYGSKNTKTLGMGDVTLDKYGWEDAGKHFIRIYKKEVPNKNLSSKIPLVCPSWWGAHVEYYFARPVNAPVIGLGNVQNLHQYSWLNKTRIEEADMDTAYCIVSSIEDTAASGVYEHFYKKNELITTIPVYRGGDTVANFYVRRLTGWKEKGEELAEWNFSPPILTQAED